MKKLQILAVCLPLMFLMGCVDQSGGQAAVTENTQMQEKNESDSVLTEETQDVENATENRIVATSIATCEILEQLAIDADMVVGVPHSDSYSLPEQYADATSIGSPMAPDMEIVSSLDPTIILTPNSLQGELEPQYDNIGVDSYFLDLKSTEGMYASILELGTMFGKETKAEALVAEYEQFKADYASRHETKEAPTVLILMGLPGSYVVATESSYAGSLVKLAGGINVYGDGDGADFLNINVEDMVQKDPDIILRTAHALPEQVMQMFANEFETNEIWQHFTAVQEGKVYDLDNEKFGMSANFNYPAALEDLEPLLYGEES